MNISMAIRTVLAHVFEDQACVALRAADLLMHPPQRITCLVVIELWVRPDRLPTCVCVALLAGDRDRSMWVRHFRLWASYLRTRVFRRLLQRHRRDKGRNKNQHNQLALTTHPGVPSSGCAISLRACTLTARRQKVPLSASPLQRATTTPLEAQTCSYR